ncbi:MAG: ComF family protein [Phycisphaerales bacterium]|nr:ComF family protein [Phycisphaerales bacterium]
MPLGPILNLARALADVVSPRSCLGCGVLIEHAGRVCAPCDAALAELRRLSYCGRCGRSARPETIDDDGCGVCRRERFWNMAGVARFGAYESPLREMVLDLKYDGVLANAEWLGAALAQRIAERPWQPIDAIVPVPMHPLRRWQRPCDHAAELAEVVSRRLGIPLRRLARRSRYSESQLRMDTRAKRFDNIAQCFEPRGRARSKGLTVCIVENMVVTGATLCEVAKALRRGGAKRIYAAFVARSSPPGQPQPIAGSKSR